MNVGKLYEVEEYAFFLFPSLKVAAASGCDRLRGAAWEQQCRLLSNDFDCNVSYIKPKSVFCVLEQDLGTFYKILTAEGDLGWICLSEFYEENYIEEITQ